MIKTQKLKNSPLFSIESLENDKSIVTIGEKSQYFDDTQTGINIFSQIEKYYTIKNQLEKYSDILSKKEKKELTTIINDLEKNINLLKSSRQETTN